jgi:putative transposase
MVVRGVIVSYEAIMRWCAKFGPEYGCRLCHRQLRPGATSHLDEVRLTINGRRRYLLRPFCQDGNVLDILVQLRRDAKAAKRFFRKLLNRQCASPPVLLVQRAQARAPARAPPTRGSRNRQLRSTPRRKAHRSHATRCA